VQIGVPRETQPRETRVAATPKTVGQLTALGYDVVVESGAGAAASFDDAAYAAAGARVVDREQAWGADIVHHVNPPSDEEIARLRPGQTLVSLMAPALSPELVERLRAAGVTAMAMDAVPRISRAQSLDVLSSMANIAGYRAVVEAAHDFGSFFTGQVTAAGKVPPAEVLVVGAGVAGLAAIGTARSLGAIVRATDARAEVAEQVESMGAEFLAVQLPEVDEAAAASSDGYAKEMGEAFNRAAEELYREQAPRADIIVTTALIPGRPAPRLITAEMVAAMKPGSVIVDMAAANGGNVEGSVADEKVVTSNGVTIIGYTDLAARLPTQASQLYGTNLVNLMKLLTPGKDGQLVLDFEDPVQRNMTVARDGELLGPPPAIQVRAAPAPVAAAAPAPKAPPAPPNLTKRHTWMAIAAIVFGAVAALSKGTFLGHFTVFALAVVVGFYVIGNVAHALHTPLMSVTNAISGIIVVGALLQLGGAGFSHPAVGPIAFLGVLVASINIFGGFTVTQRMLTMFRKG
jgi:NAD(P) transhydrogenase subunit alpha